MTSREEISSIAYSVLTNREEILSRTYKTKPCYESYERLRVCDLSKCRDAHFIEEYNIPTFQHVYF
jgi:hypothetical protein